MAEAAEFLKRTGTVIEVEEPKMIGRDPKFQKQVGRFTMEISKEWKGKTYYDYLNFDCSDKAMSAYPKEGDNVEVEFTIGGSKYKGRDGKDKYFTKLKAYKITLNFGGSPATPPQKDNKQEVAPSKEDMSWLNENSEDTQGLPF